MAHLRFTLAVYLRLLAIQIRAQLQYRTAFILEVLSSGITLFLFFASIAFVLQRFGTLGGWTLGEIAFLWGTVEFAFGLMDMIFSGFDPATFGKQVRQGLFDQLLLRPVNLTMQVLGSDFVLRRLGRITQGLIIFAVALALADIHWTVGKVLYLPLIIVGLVCFFGGLFIMGATFTFWTVESVEAVNILTYGGSEMMAYPMHIYPDWLRRTFTYVVPAIFLNYYPALYILDKPDPLGLPAFLSFISPIVGAGILLAALAFWQFGIKHYQSTGS
ncbi:MAG: ABC-2 family transporter protein [Caldilineaceae bacterium]|nr:ABC-2 family transporter protein [Caldilineaceae bacterium]